MLYGTHRLGGKLLICASSLLFAGCASFWYGDKSEQAQQCPAATSEQASAQGSENTCPELPVLTEEQLAACPPVVQCPAVSKSSGLLTVGRTEYVDVMTIPMRKKARVDTGAETTSIHAVDIKEFERDGEKWVRFHVEDPDSNDANDLAEIKAPVVRMVRIKQHGVDYVRRYVVKLDLRMGPLRDKVEVTLADRENFEYPLLIGRNFLRNRAVVDVSEKYLTLDSKK